MTILPLVNVFTTPFDHWERRKATQDEVMAELKRQASFLLKSKCEFSEQFPMPSEAAVHVAEVAPDDQRLANQIDDSLKGSPDLKEWMKAMPSSTPKGISVYQKNYSTHDPTTVNEEIKSIGATLSPGQYLFHGGCWSDKSKLEVTTDAPFPQHFAHMWHSWKLFMGKAYHDGRIDLFVLRAVSPETNVFCIHKGSHLGHEKRCFCSRCRLFAMKPSLTVTSLPMPMSTTARNKPVPVYVLEVDIS